MTTITNPEVSKAFDYERFAHAMGLVAAVSPGLIIKVEEDPPYALTVTLHNATPEIAFHIGFQAGLFGVTEVTTVADHEMIAIHMQIKEG